MPGYLIEKVKEALEAGIRQKVTRAGALFTAVILAVAVAAFVSANNLLFLILAMMMGTFLISGFVSRLVLAGLKLDFNLPDHISARHTVSARLFLYNEKHWMPSFSIHLAGTPPSAFSQTLYFPLIPAGKRLREIVDVEFQRRGTYQENGFEFWTRFPFGFTERRVRVKLRRDILVYPCLEPQPGFEALLSAVSGEMESILRGRGSDFYRIRPYEPLESSRHVDWKATAHTGDLQVREFARDQDPLVEILLDLVTDPQHPEWFEPVVDCCAYLVWNASRKESRIRFHTQDFDIVIPVEGDVYMVLKYLALVKPRLGGRLPHPSGEVSCQVVFTTRPSALEESGWSEALVLDPESFPEAYRGTSH